MDFQENFINPLYLVSLYLLNYKKVLPLLSEVQRKTLVCVSSSLLLPLFVKMLDVYYQKTAVTLLAPLSNQEDERASYFYS